MTKNNYFIIVVTFLMLSESLIFSVDVISVIVFFFVLLNIKPTLKKYYKIVLPLLLIFLIGIISARALDYNFFKDCWYFIKPVFYFMAGVILVKYFKTLESFNNIIILVAFLFTLTSVVVLFAESKVGEIVSQAYLINTSFHISYLICYAIILIGSKKYHSNLLSKFGIYLVLFFVLFLIIIFSRSLILTLIILLLFTQKGLQYVKKYFLRFGLIFGLIVIFIAFYDIDIFTTLLAKFSLSIEEITLSRSTYSIGNVSNWRGYESFVAVKTITDDASVYSYLFGKGLGATIDLGFFIKLGEGNLREIGLLHNGYLELILKTGLLGILLYLIFLYKLYRSFGSLKDKYFYFEKSFARGIVITLVINTFTTTGLYSYENCDTTLLILGLYLTYINSIASKYKISTKGLRPLTGYL